MLRKLLVIFGLTCGMTACAAVPLRMNEQVAPAHPITEKLNVHVVIEGVFNPYACFDEKIWSIKVARYFPKKQVVKAVMLAKHAPADAQITQAILFVSPVNGVIFECAYAYWGELYLLVLQKDKKSMKVLKYGELDKVKAPGLQERHWPIIAGEFKKYFGFKRAVEV